MKLRITAFLFAIILVFSILTGCSSKAPDQSELTKIDLNEILPCLNEGILASLEHIAIDSDAYGAETNGDVTTYYNADGTKYAQALSDSGNAKIVIFENDTAVETEVIVVDDNGNVTDANRFTTDGKYKQNIWTVSSLDDGKQVITTFENKDNDLLLITLLTVKDGETLRKLKYYRPASPDSLDLKVVLAENDTTYGDCVYFTETLEIDGKPVENTIICDFEGSILYFDEQ